MEYKYIKILKKLRDNIGINKLIMDNLGKKRKSLIPACKLKPL